MRGAVGRNGWMGRGNGHGGTEWKGAEGPGGRAEARGGGLIFIIIMYARKEGR